MTSEKLYVDGELFLSLESVAEIYEVRILWLQEAYEFGLLGQQAGSESTRCIAAVHLDRVATIVRMHRVLGLDLDAIALMLESRA